MPNVLGRIILRFSFTGQSRLTLTCPHDPHTERPIIGRKEEKADEQDCVLVRAPHWRGRRSQSPGHRLYREAWLSLCRKKRIELIHILPGKPVENAHVESFHGSLREECLNLSWFLNLFDCGGRSKPGVFATTRIAGTATWSIGHHWSSQRSALPANSVLMWGKGSQTPTPAPHPIPAETLGSDS